MSYLQFLLCDQPCVLRPLASNAPLFLPPSLLVFVPPFLYPSMPPFSLIAAIFHVQPPSLWHEMQQREDGGAAEGADSAAGADPSADLAFTDRGLFSDDNAVGRCLFCLGFRGLRLG